MAVNLEYRPEYGVVVARVTGSPELSDMAAAAKELILNDDYPPDVGTMWDLTDMDFHEADYSLAQEFVSLREGIKDQRGNAKLALYSDYELGYPILKMYQAMSKELPQDMRIFTNKDDAIKWLIS